MITEMFLRMKKEEREKDASMRPRSIDHGNRETMTLEQTITKASMRPRSIDHGNAHAFQRTLKTVRSFNEAAIN